jgi:hypothetical protein
MTLGTFLCPSRCAIARRFAQALPRALKAQTLAVGATSSLEHTLNSSFYLRPWRSTPPANRDVLPRRGANFPIGHRTVS